MSFDYRLPLLNRAILTVVGIMSYYTGTPYDSSHTIDKSDVNLFVVWDALYFKHIAQHGYTFEQEYAFFPVLPYVAHFVANACKHFLLL